MKNKHVQRFIYPLILILFMLFVLGVLIYAAQFLSNEINRALHINTIAASDELTIIDLEIYNALVKTLGIESTNSAN